MAERKTGTLMTREEIGRWEKTITIAQRYGLSESLATRLKQYKFVSEVQKARIDAATDVLVAEQRFMDVYHGHQLALDRLLTVHETARRHEEIERLQEENLIIKLRNERSRLQAESREVSGVTGGEAYDELEKIRQKAAFDAAKRTAQAKAKIEARRDVVRERDAIKAEMLRDAGGVVTAELERELKNIDDAYQTILDEL
jgi:hypothetical protein